MREPSDGPSEKKRTGKAKVSTPLSKVIDQAIERDLSHLPGIDLVLGGGAVRGSVILLGGEPGIGKTTIAMTIAQAWSTHGEILYVSGEEGESQVASVAARLQSNKKQNERISLLSTTNIEDVIDQMDRASAPRVVIIDSIQTMHDPDAPGNPGSPSQVRSAAQRISERAHAKGVTALIIGHITKDGQVAGPKTLEHIVDVVLMLEGERFDQLRTLRSMKNRFGPTNLSVLYEMTAHGLREIVDASKRFLDPIDGAVIGTAIASVVDGQRPVFAHVQVLATKTSFGYPRRTSVGLDLNRLHLLSAIIDRFGLIAVDQMDIYCKVAHGIHLDDPASDASIIAAIVSAVQQSPLSQKVLCLGEVGMNGRISLVTRITERLREAASLGLTDVYLRIPEKKGLKTTSSAVPKGLRLHPVTTVRDLLTALFPLRAIPNVSVDVEIPHDV